MAYIESAYLGDERSSQNVTESVLKKVQGGKINTVADSSLLPMFEVGAKVVLSNEDEANINSEAEKQCGSANDSQCLDSTKAKLRQSRLEEKEREKQSSAYLVKGRRLVVNYVDDKGQRRTVVVPEGQELSLEGIREIKEPVKPGQPPEFKPSWSLPTFTGTTLEILKIVTIILGVFFYVFSILATYRTFIEAGFKWIGYTATAVSVFFPYSGYVIMLLFFAVKEYMSIKE